MTREEAITKLVAYAFWANEHVPDEVAQALDMAIEALQENESLARSVNEASELLRKQRPHGEWEYTGCVNDELQEEFCCSICNYCTFSREFNFCPNCGSDNRPRKHGCSFADEECKNNPCKDCGLKEGE